MPYTPNTWQARQGSGLNRFQDQNGTLYEFTAVPAEVTQPGTPFSADWMNHLEQGVAAAQADVDALETSRGQPNGLATLDSTGKLVQMPTAAEVGAIPGAEKGAANGVAALDGSAKLPASALPDIAVTSDRTPAGAGSTRDNQLQMGKTLWTGNWSSGTITVPNAGAYNMFVIKTKITSGGAINDTAIIAYAVNYHVRGMGGMSTGNDQSGYNYYFNATVPEYGSESWTLNACTAQGNNSTTIAPQTVTHIIGIC